MYLRAAIATVALIVLQIVAGPATAQIVTEFSAGIPPAPAPRALVLGPDGNIWFTEYGGNRVGKITPAGLVTEYSAGISAGAGPGGITVGPDGNLWFTERLIGKIARITLAGVVTEFGGLTPGAVPVSITSGPDGNLWFTENPGNRIGRITTSGVVTEFTAGITANAGPVSIVKGPDNNLWFTEQSAPGIGRITPSGVVTEFGVGISAGANNSGIAVGPDNNIWFTELNTSKIAYITTAGVVTEFGGLTAGAGPNSITAGPDGNMWFAELNGNRVGKITLAGVVTEYSAGISPGAGPRNIVTGSDNNLWFTEYSGSQIGRITTAGVVTEFNAGITPGAQPVGIAAGPDGNLWFTESAIGVDSIGRITPAGVITQFSVGITPGARPAFIALGPDGNLWFTEYAGSRIGRITPAGVVTEFSTGITPASAPSDITAGPDGNMWFVEELGNRIGRITMAGAITEFSAGITPGSGLSGIAAGPDGNLWFTEWDGNRIGRITTSGIVTEFSAGITAFAGLSDITTGPDGNMWFTEYDSNRIGKIVALPANGTVGTVTEFGPFNGAGAGPDGIVAGPDGNLWFTADKGNRIGRITPAGVLTTYGQGISAGAGLLGITAGPDGNMWFAEYQGARIGRLLMPAAGYIVTSNNDSGLGSLRDAISRANADPGPNTVTFAPAVTGTITLTSGQIQIAQAMSIVGPGAANLTIDANALGRVFSIFQTDPACPALDGPDYLVTISGLRLTNARQTFSNSGGAIFTEHSLTLDSVTVDNSVASFGGGLNSYVQYPGQTLTITNSQFLNNKAQPIGPNPFSDAGAAVVAIDRCTGVHVAAVVNMSGSLFSGNQVLPTTLNGLGGAIYLDTIGDVTITDTRIVNNQVVLPNPPPATQIYRSGGLHVHAKTLRIERSEISDNALVDATGSDLTRGGGMIAFNTAADMQGAGDTMAAKIINSTISGNSSPATAGAMLVSGNVAMEIDNSTVSNNTAAQTRTGGVAMSVAAGQLAPTLTLASTILANNSSDGGDLAASPSGGFATFTVNATNSLIEKICPLPGCDITVAGSGNLLGVDPMLGSLAFNGGPTRTHALITGSPAINTGSNPLNLTTDQRGTGFPRVLNGLTDMGAYEGSGPPTVPVLQSAASRKVHGGVTYNLPLSLVDIHNPTTEPRQSPTATIVFTFDKPIASATAAVTESAATAGTLTFSGNDVIVPLSGIVNPQYVTITLSGVMGADATGPGTGLARVGFLLGDVNGNRVVTLSDVGSVNAQLAQTVSASNYLRDVNVSGTLSLADKAIANANLTKSLPPP